MQLTPSTPRPAALQVAVSILALVLLLATYAMVMHVLVDLSTVDSDTEANHRDLIYAYVHAGFFAASLVVGFVAGKWFSGLGFAFATLFLVVTILGVTLTQMTSYELACRGHNDLVRHWQC